MKYSTDIDGFSESDDKAADVVVEEFVDKGRKEQIKGVIEELINDEFDRLEDYGTSFITETAARRAKNFLEKVMRGDEKAAMVLFGSSDNGDRYKQLGYDAGKPWAYSIHGSIFETSGIQLRRQIVESHKDLIESERIKDLESIVDGLNQQVIELKLRLEER